MLILLDENVPAGIRYRLPGHAVRTTPEVGWARFSNGELLTAAEQAGFDVLITGDQNIAYQRDLSGRRRAVIGISTTHWPTIRADLKPLRDAVSVARPGTYVIVRFAEFRAPSDSA